MDAATIEAIAKLWPLALIIFLIIFTVLFQRTIRIILEKRSLKVKRGDTEITLDGDPSTLMLEDATSEGKVTKEVEEEGKPVSLIIPAEIDEHKEKSTDALWQDMYLAFLKNDIEGGTKAFELLQEAEQDVTKRLKNQGLFHYLCFKSGDTDALMKLKELSEEQTIKANAQNWLGLCYLSTMDYELAAKAFESAAESSEKPKERATYTVSHVNALFSLDELDGSLNILFEAISKSDNDEEKVILYQGLAAIFEKMEDKQNQAISLENALRCRANDTDLRFKVAYAYSEAGFNQMAMLHYETLLRFKPDSYISRNNLGVAYQALGLKAHSSQAYKNASDNAETLASANLAYKFMVEGLYEEAQELLNQAMKAEDVHENVGTAIADLKNRGSDEDEKRESVLIESKKLRRHFLSYSNSMGSYIEKPISISATFVSDDKIEFEVVVKRCSLSVNWELSGKKYQIIGSMRNLAVKGKKNDMEYSLYDKSERGYKEVGTAYGYFSEDLTSMNFLIMEGETLKYVLLHKSES